MSDPNLNKLQEQLAQKKAALARRFEEVARLTEQLEKEQAEVDALEAKIKARPKQEAKPEPKPKPDLAHMVEKNGLVILTLTQQQREKNRKHLKLISESDLFDAEWYLETYADVAKSDKFADNPAEHYTLFGGFEGRKPCPEFDTSFYLKTYPDVAKLCINPLAHYLQYGRDEGRIFARPLAAKK